MAQAWPYQEAQRIRIPEGRPVVFETGYGPSGLPHIGTFTEVLRTQMVRRAFEELNPGVPTRLIVFSDDMDALRKVPENVPNREEMEQWLGYSLSRVPDPFGTHESFAAHNNAMLREFLDRFGFNYEFMSANTEYRAGRFNETLRRVLDNYDTVAGIILPTLGEERRATYCPFMPIMGNGRVVGEGYVEHSTEGAGWVAFEPRGPEGGRYTFPIENGHCKLQWKVDWAMRWLALGVDYEMAGKDLIDSVTLSSRIVRALGGSPPVNMIYEMFLDEQGRKISKSLGNGLTIDEWLRYGPPDSLAYYLYREPKKAKKLYAALVPKAVDEYWQARDRYREQTVDQQRANPVHHVLLGVVPEVAMPVTFALILNLIGILGDTDEETVWGYIRDNYAADAGPDVRALIPYALAYHRDHIAGDVVRRPLADIKERDAFIRLIGKLVYLPASATAEDIQFEVYEVGKECGYAENLRGWFQVVYETIFGSTEGPRLGTFIAVYGVGPFISLLEEKVSAYNFDLVAAE